MTKLHVAHPKRTFSPARSMHKTHFVPLRNISLRASEADRPSWNSAPLHSLHRKDGIVSALSPLRLAPRCTRHTVPCEASERRGTAALLHVASSPRRTLRHPSCAASLSLQRLVSAPAVSPPHHFDASSHHLRSFVTTPFAAECAQRTIAHAYCRKPRGPCAAPRFRHTSPSRQHPPDHRMKETALLSNTT